MTQQDEKGFLAELLYFARTYWLWWVIPIGLVILATLVLVVANSGGESGFDYHLF